MYWQILWEKVTEHKLEDHHIDITNKFTTFSSNDIYWKIIFGISLQIFTPKVYGVLMASNALYRNFAESFLGRPALNQAELDAMCFTFAFADTLVIQSGYTNKCNIRTVIPTQLNPQFPSNPLGLGTFALNVTLAQSPGSTTANQCKNFYYFHYNSVFYHTWVW